MKIDSKKQIASRAHASATCYVENEIASREAIDYLNNIWCLQKQNIDQKLKLYIELLLKWNKTINLIAKSTEANIYERHILDSLQLMDLIDDKNIHIADLGSGAGLPGIILSIAGVKEVSLIESDVRKATFLRQASQLSANIIHVKNERLENVVSHFDLITARAFADLNKIFSLSQHLNINRYLLMKGKNYRLEIDVANQNWRFDLTAHASRTDQDAKILDIRNVKAK